MYDTNVATSAVKPIGWQANAAFHETNAASHETNVA
jgi:hypothetical protein